MIDQHTFSLLEFPKLISQIRGHCLTPYGSGEVDKFMPMFTKQAIEKRQLEIIQLKDIYNFGRAFPLARMEDSREILSKVTIVGAFLDPKEILAVCELVEISIAIHQYDYDSRENFPDITTYLQAVRAFPELKKEINRAIDPNGDIKDTASSVLKKIRQNIGDTKRRIIRTLDSILSEHQKQPGWQDDVITQRNDRYVIPILAGQYKANQGILHDRSQSGATLYIEPKETVELNNRANMLKQDEHAEIIKILRAISFEIAQRADSLNENISIIGKLDALYAVAKTSNDIGANSVNIIDQPSFDLIDARHPLLLLKFEKQEQVIPLSVTVNSNRQALLITGPNTGGKTIALKTIGLMVLMAQSGLPIPADETSSVGIFENIYADIGDEQSIELSLSTFSSHIKNISKAIANVSENSLVILDEIGAGTDPKEGASLAEAIILHMISHKTRLIASTHYSVLKTLALNYPEIENASLEFDRETLTPTYRLQMGIPGSSYAVEIARRLGIPESICDKATELVGSGERSVSELIASLEDELKQVRSDKIKLSESLENAKELENYYKTKTSKIQIETDQLQAEQLSDTDQLLKTTRQQVEKMVAEIRHSQANPEKVKEIHRFLKEKQSEVSGLQAKRVKNKSKTNRPDRIFKGDHVRILSLNQEGEVAELLSKDKARVTIGSMNTVISIRDLEKLCGKIKNIPQKHGSNLPVVDSLSPEIHLRGMTVEDAMESLDKYLDQAVIAGLTQVYVVHGKGTGTLRRILTDYLKNHSEIASVRLGDWNEGGAGVTIARLKK